MWLRSQKRGGRGNYTAILAERAGFAMLSVLASLVEAGVLKLERKGAAEQGIAPLASALN
ncbi:MAG: hypothetical protein DRJ56_08205 [Thermoprotei archaeon]|nr:MAG: hypothetical protein DRJ56_08205 [Thermoprotei archaeon]